MAEANVDHPGEQWRPIPGYPKYEASNLGRIRSLRCSKPRILKQIADDGGYLRVNIRSLSFPQTASACHRLVLMAFVGWPPFPEAQCDHINGVRDDNRPENLRWVDQFENMQAAYERRGGKRPEVQGERHGASKLTIEQVREIRSVMKQNPRHGWAADLARKFGVHRQAIYHVARGNSWVDVS